jgi:K+-transporting ATPase A subunit
MHPNVGAVDRTLRIIVALAIALLYFTGKISGLVAIVLAVVAAVFLVTSVLARCPAYLPFHVSTRKNPPAAT